MHGPWEPQNGHRFNPAKLLLDPYAKAIDGTIRWSDSVFGYRVGPDPDADLSQDDRDSADAMPKSVVVDDAFDWRGDRPPRIPWHRTVIYEAHVKGLTKRHPGVPEGIRGTYLALTCEPVLDHLQNLGVTAVELLPVHHFVDDRHLVERGLAQLLGLQLDRLLRPGRPLRAPGRPRRAGARVQDDGPRAPRRRASRSSSTWSTTTPPRATSSARR